MNTVALLDAADLDQLAELIADKLSDHQPERSEDRWMDSKEAAEYLSIPVSRIRELTAAEQIPFSQDRPGCHCFFLRSLLDEWRMKNVRGVVN